MKKVLVVSEETEGRRLDKFLSEHLSFLSRTKIHNLINKGAVSVNGLLKKPSFHLCGKQQICVTIDEKKKLLRPFKLAVNIIYEDKDIIVIDKPCGLVVHPPQEHYYKTLVNALLYLKKELFAASPLRPGVVHRLDKETSGVIVLAKNKHSSDNIIEQFKQRKVKKEYRAIVWGKINKDKLNVNLPLGRDEKNRLKMKVSLLKSKTAYTDIEVIKKLRGATYLRVKPLTGRMHQIRVHLKFLEFPIIGDKKYGIKDNYKELFLHAKTLSFYHPCTGNLLKFNSSLPERFKKFINEYQSKEPKCIR